MTECGYCHQFKPHTVAICLSCAARQFARSVFLGLVVGWGSAIVIAFVFLGASGK